jgi:ATP-dependent RNA helicase DeaD
MPTFEELGLAPELVEALAAEGLESPTALQREAVPVIRRGNSLVAASGPGAGTLVAYGAALLDRLGVDGATPGAIVLTPTASGADRLAQSLARLARSTGHRVAALGGAWALPGRADILFATVDDLLLAVRESEVKLDAVEAFILDGGATIQQISGLDTVRTILEFLPSEGQRVLFSLPLTPELDDFARAHFRKAVQLAGSDTASGAPERGSVHFRITGEEKGDEILDVVAPLLEDEIHHVLIFFRTEDQAADVGDYLALHGFAAGSPGDPDTPVWLGIDEMEARAVLQAAADLERIATVSFDVPADVDSLDRRHGGGAGGTVLVLARELPHLKSLVGEAGYRLTPASTPPPPRVAAELAAFRGRVEIALDEEDLAPHLLLLEPLFRTHAPAEVAAALTALLRRGEKVAAGAGERDAASMPVQPRASRAPAWVHLFLTLGSKDGISPGDLVGAITGEADIAGNRIGKIEIKDTFSRVEVEEAVAAQVIKALNGVTVKGRSVRVDYDRKEARGAEGREGTRPGPRQRRSLAGRSRGDRPGGGSSGGEKRGG